MHIRIKLLSGIENDVLVFEFSFIGIRDVFAEKPFSSLLRHS